MKPLEIRKKTIEELKKELSDQRHDLQKALIDIETKKLKNHNQIKDIKKNIARLLTILSEKEFLADESLNEDKKEQ